MPFITIRNIYNSDVPGDEGERVEIPHHDRLGFLRIGGTPRVDGRRSGEVLAVVRIAGQQGIDPGIVGRAVGMGVFPVPQIESDGKEIIEALKLRIIGKIALNDVINPLSLDQGQKMRWQ